MGHATLTVTATGNRLEAAGSYRRTDRALLQGRQGG